MIIALQSVLYNTTRIGCFITNLIQVQRFLRLITTYKYAEFIAILWQSCAKIILSEYCKIIVAKFCTY